MNKKLLNYSVYIILILILCAGFYSRTRNIPALDSQYLLSPDDPYIFLRYSNSIAETGSIPANDTLRYYPIGHDTSQENTFIAYLAGYSLNFIKIALSPSLVIIASNLPTLPFDSLFTALSTIVFTIFSIVGSTPKTCAKAEFTLSTVS